MTYLFPSVNIAQCSLKVSRKVTYTSPKLSCIEGTWKNKCHIADESGEQMCSEVWEKKVSYYQFLTVAVSYIDKGVKKFYTQTARKC